MAFTLHPLTFLILGGLGTLFETISRPAVTAIIRLQYPPTHRGTITGAIRQWHMIAFLISSALAAALLDLAGAHCFSMIKIQLVFAGLASGAAFLVLRTIRLRSDVETAGGVPMLTLWKPFQDAVAIMRGDRRFLWYLCIGFLYAFGGLIYVSYIPVLFSREFHWNYFTASFMANTLPNLVAILTTGSMGRWIDRVNSWKAWAAIRLGWGADPLLLGFASSLSVVSPAWTWAATFAGRLSRGVVMGGSWILWWQVGVNHFARPGDDTARYMGMIIFVNGLARLSAPVVGGWILLRGFSISAVLIIGSILVLVSGALSQMRYRKERGHARYESMTQFEA